MATKTAKRKSVKSSVRSNTKRSKVTRARGPRVTYEENQKIQILPKGKENPRRTGGAPYKRYEVLLKSRTVGAFLKKLPKWSATIRRAEKQGLVRVV